MVGLRDLEKLVENYHRFVKTTKKRKDQLLIEAIYTKYLKANLENKDDVLSRKIEISREELIWEVWRPLKTETKRSSFWNLKNTINENLEKMEKEGLNPKRIRIKIAENKGFGETDNYFLALESSTGEDEENQQKNEEKPELPDKATPLDLIKKSYEEYKRNPFIGNEDKIAEWVEALHSSGSEPATFLITGMPGTGKSHLAVWLALKVQKTNRESQFIWVDLQGIAETDAALTKLYDKVFGTTPQLNDVQLKLRLIEKLKKEKGVIVLDDLLPTVKIEEFIQIAENSLFPLIITSQSIRNSENFFNKEILLCCYGDIKEDGVKLTEDECIELFKNRSRVKHCCPTDEKIIEKICDMLGWHPFWITLTAKEWWKARSSIGETIQECQHELQKLLTSSHQEFDVIEYERLHKASLEKTIRRLDNNLTKVFYYLMALPYPTFGEAFACKFLEEMGISRNPKRDIRNLVFQHPLIFAESTTPRSYRIHQFISYYSRWIEDFQAIEDRVCDWIKSYLEEHCEFDNDSSREQISEGFDQILKTMGYFKKQYLDNIENNIGKALLYAEKIISMESIVRHYFYIFNRWTERRQWGETISEMFAPDSDIYKGLSEQRQADVVMAKLEGIGFLYANQGEKENSKLSDILDWFENLKESGTLDFKKKSFSRCLCFYFRLKGYLFSNQSLTESNGADKNFDNAKSYFEKALTLAQETGWESIEVALYIQLLFLILQWLDNNPEKRWTPDKLEDGRKYVAAIKEVISNLEKHNHGTNQNQKPIPYRRQIRGYILLAQLERRYGNLQAALKAWGTSEQLYTNKNLFEDILAADLMRERAEIMKQKQDNTEALSCFSLALEKGENCWSAELIKQVKQEINTFKEIV